MAVNPFYNFHGFSTEQDLISDLVIESIKQYGLDFKYLPRSVVALDNLYGEDALRAYNTAVSLEMYIKDVDGFGGEGDFLSRFGLEIRDQMTLTVAQKRFTQVRAESLITELGYNLLLEDGGRFLLEDGDGDNYTITSSRPLEGDLIFFPYNNKLYEIKFVEHEAIFYQNAALQTYDLTVELFEYSSETFATGNTVIDAIETNNTLSVSNNAILLETGDRLLNEDGGYILSEYTIETTDNQANNTFFESGGQDYINFSEINPYGDARY